MSPGLKTDGPGSARNGSSPGRGLAACACLFWNSLELNTCHERDAQEHQIAAALRVRIERRAVEAGAAVRGVARAEPYLAEEARTDENAAVMMRVAAPFDAGFPIKHRQRIFLRARGEGGERPGGRVADVLAEAAEQQRTAADAVDIQVAVREAAAQLQGEGRAGAGELEERVQIIGRGVGERLVEVVELLQVTVA